jgi:hypothetical protein
LGNQADAAIYERMIENLKRAASEAMARFTPLFGRSQKVIPKWIAEQGSDFQIDLAFLDGGNNPLEQITEFHLIDPHMPLGAILMTHDAKLRKGKWLVPYISRLDNWESKLYDVSDEGLFLREKTRSIPRRIVCARPARSCGACDWRRPKSPQRYFRLKYVASSSRSCRIS